VGFASHQALIDSSNHCKFQFEPLKRHGIKKLKTSYTNKGFFDWVKSIKKFNVLDPCGF
jgi:hypothetical protein